MTAIHAPAPEEEENSKELTDQEKELWQQDQSGSLFAQIMMGAALSGVTYADESIKAYNFLKKDLDPHKLVTDPVYRRRVERAVRLNNRHAKIGMKSVDKPRVEHVQQALERTSAIHSKLKAVKANFLSNNAIYLNQLGSIYGLDEKQLLAIKDGAWKRVLENPTLSLNDALRIEAETASLKTLQKEVEEESGGQKLTKKQKEESLESKKLGKQYQFQTATDKFRKDEIAQTEQIVSKGEKDVADKLGLKPQAATADSSQPATSTAPQPSVTTAPPVQPPSPPQAVPPPSPAFPPGNPVPAITGAVSPGSIPLPNNLAQGLNNVSSNFKNLFSGVNSRINTVFGGLNNAFGGLGSKLGGMFGKGNAFSKAFNLAVDGAKKLLNAGLDALAPGAGRIIGKLNDAVKALFGIDVEATLIKGVVLVGVCVLVIIIIIPLFFAQSQMSYLTANHPLNVSALNGKTLGWNEFENNYLSVKPQSKVIGMKGNEIAWKEFSESYLEPKNTSLSFK